MLSQNDNVHGLHWPVLPSLIRWDDIFVESQGKWKCAGPSVAWHGPSVAWRWRTPPVADGCTERVIFPQRWPGTSTMARWPMMFLPRVLRFVKSNPASSIKMYSCGMGLASNSNILWKRKRHNGIRNRSPAINIVKNNNILKWSQRVFLWWGSHPQSPIPQTTAQTTAPISLHNMYGLAGPYCCHHTLVGITVHSAHTML